MQKIFINYRNGDGDYAAGHLHAYLCREMGQEQVFKSSISIAPGEAYEPALLERAAGCPVMLSVIGPTWAEVKGKAGERRLFNADDWVRKEIALALGNGRRVIPVLLSNAKMPGEGELPDDLKALASLQYRYFYHRNGEWDIKRLHSDLIELVPELGRAPGRRAAGDTFQNNAHGNAQVGGMFGRVDGNVQIGGTHER